MKMHTGIQHNQMKLLGTTNAIICNIYYVSIIS